MSYRSGHHSTSDDSSRYRTAEEMSEWRARDPATRFHNFLVSRGWWDDDRERQLRVATRKEVCSCAFIPRRFKVEVNSSLLAFNQLFGAWQSIPIVTHTQKSLTLLKGQTGPVLTFTEMLEIKARAVLCLPSKKSN